MRERNPDHVVGCGQRRAHGMLRSMMTTTIKRALLRTACIAALVSGCAPAGRAGDAAAGNDNAQSLRVMTYNIHAGTGGLDRIADVIRVQQPDIVGLQEVDVHFSARSDFVDQASTLAESLGMEMRFAHIYELAPETAGAPPREYGVALLSRHPITAFHNHLMPRLSTVEDEPEPRPRPGFLEATVQIGDVAVRVFNTHLDYRGDPRVRRMQVAETLRIIGATSAPTVLMGDLNAEPDAAELQPLLQRLRDAWTTQTTA
ncbi:MAG: endonuclease/exonuclease/phosphatase family protein, partial [Longimicrobiales bacterium]